MKKLLFAVAFSVLFSCGVNHSVNPVESGSSGSANVSINVGAVGALAKTANIALAKLYITLTAPGQVTINDSFTLSGTSSTTINKTYANLASLLTWTLTARSIDSRDSVIHSGSTTFTVQPNQVANVSLSLNALYSMLKANFFPIRDSVTECRLTIDSPTVVRDSVFAKQTLVGDTVRLAYDYLTASTAGIQHTVKMDAHGIMWGISYLLYTGQTNILTISGQNQSYTVTLNWVGPNTPPPGQATITVTMGAVGTQTVNGALTPSGTTAMDIDGNVYHEVTIGTQTWMVENLKTTRFNDGTPIPLITISLTTFPTEWNNLTTPGFCWYKNDSTTYKNPYGALYNWYSVNTGKLAPTGWHVPSYSEWNTLITYLGGNTVAWEKLEDTSTTNWFMNYGATNETGFSALPGGSCDLYGFMYFGQAGMWWSSTESDDISGSWSCDMASYIGFADGDPWSYGLSVRCIRD
jgi:uncharacterized protein (TIGR02145 family)